MEELLNKQLSLDGQARCVANTELLLLSKGFGKKAPLKATLHTELAQLVQWMSQIESKQVKQDDIVWSLQEQIEGIESALVQEDEDSF